ncbi:hypothetical protein CBR_g45506 [Chara braunii]|uniref:CCHC-type domain-containing protein n=1 Tax=Chara braunii TaxID=69332 RepID=A0A388LYP5_CHABU|nr:hypothetical protein CBR_g45506 [Chara braunii]|eukprot:GBG87448.1 hypothetical protein CBR_g45506 [Chara braunii]
MYNNGNGGGNNGNNGGNGYNGNGGGWGGRSNGPQCYKCGKYCHIARECWAKRGRPSQQDDEVHLFVRDLMKEREEKHKREEEEEKQRLKLEKEKKRELDLATRTEEMRLQLQAEIAEKWRKQQEEAAEKIKAASEATVGQKGPKSPDCPKISRRSKGIKKSNEKRNDSKARRRKKEIKRPVVTSSSETDDDSATDSDRSSDSDRELLKMIKRLRESKMKNKIKKLKAHAVNISKKNPSSTWEKGECSKRSSSPVATPGEEAEPRTPLTKGFKGVAAGSSQEGMMDYTLSVMKQLSAKKVSELKEMCEKRGIKPAKKDEMGLHGESVASVERRIATCTVLLGLGGELSWLGKYLDKMDVPDATLDLKTRGTYVIVSPWSKRVYVGYTAQPILHRWRQHLAATNSKALGKAPQLYRWMRRFGVGNFVVLPIRHTTEEDDAAFEKYLIRDLSPSLNMVGAGGKASKRARRRRGRRERKGRSSRSLGQTVVRLRAGGVGRTSFLNWLEEKAILKEGDIDIEFHAGCSWSDGWSNIVASFGDSIVLSEGKRVLLRDCKMVFQSGAAVKLAKI